MANQISQPAVISAVSFQSAMTFSGSGRTGARYEASGMSAGETPEACLIRELDEELGIKVTKACLAPFVFASHGYETMHLLMPLYLCRRWEGFVTAREHAALAWVKPEKMGDYPMPPADAPLVAWLRDLL